MLPASHNSTFLFEVLPVGGVSQYVRGQGFFHLLYKIPKRRQCRLKVGSRPKRSFQRGVFLGNTFMVSFIGWYFS